VSINLDIWRRRCRRKENHVGVGKAELVLIISVFGQSGAGNNWAKGHYTEGQFSEGIA
jgi:hypothetical protein